MIARLRTERGRTLVMFAGFTVAALILTLWQGAARRGGGASWLDSVVCAASRPLQQVLVTCADFLEKEWMATVHARDLIEENAALSARVATLEGILSRIDEQRAAGSRQDALRSAYPDIDRDHLARIIAVGEGGWHHFFTLDRGSADGVHVRDVAVTPEGVIGQVFAVTAHTARLIPLTEPASTIGVRVQRSRDTGLLKGLGNWRCEIRYLAPDADVEVGDAVLTSGLGGVFPAGLRVGTVTSVRAERTTLGKAAEVEPAADLRTLEDVLLLAAREHVLAGADPTGR